MIYEKWDTHFDVARLQEHVKKYVLPLESIQQSPAFGGWSVLSATGSYKDGWLVGHKVVTTEMSKESFAKNLKNFGFQKSDDYTQPTEICHGYLKEVMDFLLQSGLNPRRARIIRLTKGLSSIWHRDGPDNLYFVRLHVPIFTNPGCIFEAEENDIKEAAHMPADGSSYILRVNRMHRVSNHGTEDRFHLVMDIKDTNGLTQHHRYDGSLDDD